MIVSSRMSQAKMELSDMNELPGSRYSGKTSASNIFRLCAEPSSLEL